MLHLKVCVFQIPIITVEILPQPSFYLYSQAQHKDLFTSVVLMESDEYHNVGTKNTVKDCEQVLWFEIRWYTKYHNHIKVTHQNLQL